MKLPHISLEGKHLPVMLDEVLEVCNSKNDGLFMDCTFGSGGYSKEILKLNQSKIIALDRDKKVIGIAEELKNKFPTRFSFYNKRFSNLDEVAKKKFDTVIFDLGISSTQLDDLSRGFSFKSKNELNMSMGLTDLSAKKVINNFSEDDLKKIFKLFGEEKDASKIAKNIIKKRSIKSINTTDELVTIIKNSKKKDYKKKIDESTKTFQAIRIFVNQEISELIEGITKATKILKPGGKLIVISFHSIEDKIVKFYFKNFSQNQSRTNRYFPENKIKNTFLFKNYKNKIITASTQELKKNPRSRSAKLRFAIRSNEEFEDPKELRKKFQHLTDLEKKIA
tara:strand:+ start:6542 stop:7552 length:1011 start_codon:yes stop_codon:yes gene_type:complete